MLKPKLDRWLMAMRASNELTEGMVVNLGAGIPTLASTFVEPTREVIFHCENGLIGYGAVIEDPDEIDPYCVNASGQAVRRVPGTAFVSHEESFALIRGGRIDVTILGALEVGANGDLANYHQPGRPSGGLGGAQDLATCAKRVLAVMTHVAKDGSPKLVSSVTLPLTAPTCVSRVITDIAVVDVTADGFLLREVVEGWTVDEVRQLTGAPLLVAEDLCTMSL